MHFPHERIIRLAWRERDGFEAKRRRFRMGWRRESCGVSESHEGEGHFTLGIDIQEAVDAGVHEAADQSGRQSQGGSDGQQVG